MRSYTNRRTEFGIITNNTTTANLSLGDRLMNDTDRYLINRYNLNESLYTTTTVANTQNYKLPFNYNRVIDVVVTIGTIKYTLKPITSRVVWDRLNYVAYTTNIPEYYYIYGDYIYIFPVPSTSSYTISIYYKTRIKDLSQADYTSGTISVTNGSTTITGSGTTFTNSMVGRWLQVTAPSGDNEWYKIAGFTSTTVLTLFQAYTGPTASGATYTIGEMSILDENFQDIPLWRACMIYFSSRVKDPQQFKMFQELYNSSVIQMDKDLTNKTDNMVLSTNVQRLINPNLYISL